MKECNVKFVEGKEYQFIDEQENQFKATYEGFIEEQHHFSYSEILPGSILAELGNEIGDDFTLTDFFIEHMKTIHEVPTD